MKYFTLAIVLLSFACTAPKEKLQLTIIPQPNKVIVENGTLTLGSEISIGINSEKLKPLMLNFIHDFNELYSFKISDYKNAKIKIELNNSNLPNEAYSLLTKKDGVTIGASSKSGIFYALQSLKQMLLFAEIENGKANLPLVKINDVPRYKWRGLMLDESRYFFGTKKVKQLLDLMALHKLNVFHWHLTDDPGWRIEIKKYPKLATVGGLGNDLDTNAPAQYYSQDEIRAIVQYAADRFITVIPEIDMPGHARAANRAYPEFSGGGSKSHPNFTFNPGNEATYDYLSNILKEVSELFPANYIHIGGDEVHFGNEKWKSDKYVQALMNRQNLKSLREVEQYFIQRMADSIQTLNKTLVGWDEIVDFDLNKENSIVMWWRHDKSELLGNALEKDYKVVLCPRIPLYFDFDQEKSHKYGRKWGGAFSPLEMVYAFPPDTLPKLKEKGAFVKGIQANLWTERIQSNKRLDYMTHPRLSALAEAAWTIHAEKDYNSFEIRMEKMLLFLKAENINFFNPFIPEQCPEPIGRLKSKK